MKNFIFKVLLIFCVCISSIGITYANGSFNVNVSSGQRFVTLNNFVLGTNISIGRNVTPVNQSTYTLSSGIWSGTDGNGVVGNGTATLTVDTASLMRLSIIGSLNTKPNIDFSTPYVNINTGFLLFFLNVGDITATSTSGLIVNQIFISNALSINFEAPIRLGCTSNSLSALGDITLNGNIDGGAAPNAACSSLTVTSPGNTTLGGRISGFGGLANFTSNGGGSTFLNMDEPIDINARNMSFTDGETVILQKNMNLLSIGGVISFTGTVDGNFSLTTDAFTTNFYGDVGSTTPLLEYSSGATEHVSFGGNVFTTVGTQTFNDSFTVLPPAFNVSMISSAGDITFGGFLQGNNNYNLSLNANNINFLDQVGRLNKLQNLIIENTPRVVNNVTFLGLFKAQQGFNQKDGTGKTVFNSVNNFGTLNCITGAIDINNGLFVTGNITSTATSGDITFLNNGSITTSFSPTNIVNLNATSGMIVDNTSTTNVKIKALTLNMLALNGIGAIDPLRTQVSNIRFNNTFDQTNITNNGLVFISGNSNFGQGGQLEAAGNIGVNASVSASEDFTINSTDGSLTVNSNVTHFGIGFPRNMSLLADGDIIFSAGLVSFNTPQTADELVITASNGIIDKTSTGNSPVISAFIVKPTAQNGIGVTNPITTRVSNIVFVNTNNAVQVTEANDISIAGQNGTGQTNFTTLAGNIAFNNFNSISGIETNGPITLNASGFIRGNVPSGLNVSGTNLSMAAANGIGNTNPIETNVNAISYVNTTTNRVQIIESDNVTLTGTDNASGAFDDIRSTNGNIGLIAPGVSSTSLLFLGAPNGSVTTPAGIPANAILTTTPSTDAQIGGTFQPGGTSIGLAEVNGRFRLSSAALNIQINDTNTSGSIAGTDYDAITLTSGNAFVDNTTLTVTDLGSTSLGAEPMTILTQLGGGAINGTFAGLPEGATVSVGTNDYIISYTGGDGNDITLTLDAQTNVTLAAGQLLIEDLINKNDNLTLTYGGGTYVLTDINGDPISCAISGSTGSGTSTVIIPDAGVTSVLVTTLGGNDLFTPDFSGGNFNVPINYDGGTQTAGDAMALTGVSPGGTFDSVEHIFVNENDGSVSVSGNSLITYTGLEPIIDNLDVNDRIFTFTSALDETITLNASGTLDNRINSNVGGELVDFTNPNTSLTINTEAAGGAGMDMVSVQGVDVNFNANFIVNASDEDIVAFEGGVATDVGTGDVTIVSDVISALAMLSTTGNISFTSNESIRISTNGVIQSSDGNILFNAGVAPEAGDNFTAITINSNGVVQTTGTGSITFNGDGFGTVGFLHGVQIGDTGSVLATGSGSINITALGAVTGTEVTTGITIFDSSILRTNGGGITINATGGGTAPNEFNDGFAAFDDIIIEDTNNGGISITAQAGAGAGIKAGIYLAGQGVFVRTSDGNIQLNGTSTSGSTDLNDGVLIEDGATVEATGTGMITINGTGGAGTSENNGVVVFGADTVISTNGGGITIDGTGGDGTDSDNIGVLISDSASVRDTALGAISITGIGGDGINTNFGISLQSSGSIQTIDGAINLSGSGGMGTGIENQGVSLRGISSIQSANGSIDIAGQGGFGTNDSSGVAMDFGAGSITSIDGNITINATGGNGTANAAHGLLVADNGTIETTGIGNVSIIGSSGTAIDDNNGIILVSNSAIVRSNNGNITLEGTSNGTGSFNNGIVNRESAIIQSTGSGSISVTGNGSGLGIANLGVNIFSSATVISNSGTIQITGTAGDGTSFNKGVEFATGTVSSSGGNINITGTGGSGTGDFNQGVTIRDFAAVSTTGAGTLTLSGISGTGTNNNWGTEIVSNGTVFSSENGNILITGTSLDATGTDQRGLFIQTEITTTGTGNITLNGTAGNAGSRAIFLQDFNSRILSGGTATVNAITGPLTTPTGIPPASLVTGTTVTFTGEVASGDNTGEGQFLVTGDTILSAGDELSISVNDFNSFGSDYDQLAVTGTVDITGATLNIVDNTSETGELCDEMTIIDNDGADAIVGEFAGAAEGTDLNFNGELWRISYVGGDGNDAILAFNPGMVAAPICINITLQLDANGTPITITPADVDGGTPMGCDFDSLSIDMDTFDCSNVGPNNVVLTVTDIFGNTNSCTAVVTVEDVTPPIIGCVADFTVSTSPDSCDAVVVFATPSVIDNCSAVGDITVTQVTGIPSGGTFPQGVNQVVFTATDEAGNESSCTFFVTVEDTTAPVAVCMDATVSLDATGNATITAAAVNGGSTDNCGIMSTSVSTTSFTCADVGENTVTLTVTDINGNTDSCDAIITVVDATAPTAVCQDITVALGADGTVTLDGSLIDNGSSDACGAGILTFTTDPATLTCANLGNNFVDLIVTDENGNSLICTAVVTVEDNIDPVLVCQDTTIELGADGTATIDPMQLLDMTNPLDNCSLDTLTVDITEVTCNDVGGSIDITVFAADGSGNFASCVATVTVVDTSGPVFDQASLPQGPLTRMIDPATGFYRLEDFTIGATASDNCSEGLLAIEVDQFPFAGTPLFEGTYDITLTAIDDQGNETDYVFVLIVEPALGVEDNDINLSTITMYPNPASDRVILSNPQNIPLRDVQIYDLTGRLVQKVDLSEGLSETIIDVSNLQSATYMFIISTDEVSITKQMIKE